MAYTAHAAVNGRDNEVSTLPTMRRPSPTGLDKGRAVCHIHAAVYRCPSWFFPRIEVGLSPSGRLLRRLCAWLLVGFFVGQGLLPDMVLCVEADGRLMVEPAVKGKCRDVLPAPLAATGFGSFVSNPSYCELCLDLPLAGEPTGQQRPPAPPQTTLPSVPVTALHPLFHLPTAPQWCAGTPVPLLLIPSATRLALRSTILLV